MGGISRSRLSHFKALLTLSNEAIELADRYNLDEGKLRHVVRLPSDIQVEALRQIIKHNLDARQIKRLIEETDEATSEKEPTPDRQVIQFARLIQSKDMPSVQSIAQMLLENNEDVVLVKRRVERLRELLVELERHLVD